MRGCTTEEAKVGHTLDDCGFSTGCLATTAFIGLSFVPFTSFVRKCSRSQESSQSAATYRLHPSSALRALAVLARSTSVSLLCSAAGKLPADHSLSPFSGASTTAPRHYLGDPEVRGPGHQHSTEVAEKGSLELKSICESEAATR